MQRSNDQSLSAILVTVLVVIALTSTTWTKDLFGRGDEKAILLSQSALDQLNQLEGGQEDQTKMRGKNMLAVLTTAQHLELPVEVSRECSTTFVRYTMDVKISPFPLALDQLNSYVEGREDQVKAMISSENIPEVLTMAQHLAMPIDVRRACNQRFVKCTADVKGGQSEAFIWMRQNVEQETCKQILDDVDSSSTCKEELVNWAKAKATPSCCKTQSQRKPHQFFLFSNKSV